MPAIDAPLAPRPTFLRWLTVGTACYVGWLAANLILAALFPFLILAELALGRAGARFVRAFSVAFLRLFFLGYLPLVGLYRVAERPDLARLTRLGPALVAANHRSWLDALLLIALVPGVRVLVNAGYRRVPIVGRGMRWVGCISIDKRSAESAVAALGEMRSALEGGALVAVFPEGTRSAVGQLRAFSGAFFRTAVDAGRPVAPLIVHTSEPFLGPRAENFLTAGRAVLRIRLLDPLTPDPLERGDDLAHRVRKAMAEELAGLDADALAAWKEKKR